jgi:DNA-binding Lrp family transcriptional regulator
MQNGGRAGGNIHRKQGTEIIRAAAEGDTLDGFDRRLLAALAAKGDLTIQELAAKVGLSESQCYRRRLRLEQIGAIRGYRAIIDPLALGLTVGAFVKMSMVSQSKHQRHEFAACMATLPSVLSCHAVTGDADYIMRVRAADLSGLNDLVNGLLAHGEDRMHLQSAVVLETIKDA